MSAALCFRRMCRTCLLVANSSSDHLQSIEESPVTHINPHNISIAAMLNEVSPELNVRPEDELPKRMCSSCVNKLLNMYEFQVMAYSSDRHLRILVEYNHRLEEVVKMVPSIAPTSTFSENGSVVSESILPIVQEVDDAIKSDEECDEVEFIDEPKADIEAPIVVSTEVISSSTSKKNTSAESVAKTVSRKKKTSKEYKCQDCGKLFKRKVDINRHLDMHLSQVKKNVRRRTYPINCTYCNAVLRDWPSLRDHERSHRTVKLYACSECGAKFNTQQKVQQHVLHHTQAQTQTENLLENIDFRDYYKDNPFQCEHCHKRFAFETEVRMHARKHTPKMYNCEYCMRAFHHSGHFKRHIRLHFARANHQPASAADSEGTDREK